VLKDHSIPGENRVALSKSLANELRRHKQKSRDHLFELYLLAAGIRQEYLDLANGHYSDEFNSWYTSENIKDVFGKLSNFTKYASAGEAIAYVAELGSTPKKYLPNLPTSMIALYAISQIIKRHPDAFAVCLNFTPRRRTLTSDKTDWITKKPALIHEDVTQNELNTWLQSWENPEKTPKDCCAFYIYLFILFMTHSFMRPTEGEIFSVRHRDIRILDNPSRLVIKIAQGKTGFREANTTRWAPIFYEKMKKLYPEHAEDDFVFFPQYLNRRTAIKNFNRQFNYLLERADLKKTNEGLNRSSYSLRHYSLQTRLRKSNGKVNIFLLAKTAGTSVDQLERFYIKNLEFTDAMVENLQSFGK
jgi:hypothetical protein